jgi:hypothetical protein
LRLATSLARLALAIGPPAAAGQALPTSGRRFAAVVLSPSKLLFSVR